MNRSLWPKIALSVGLSLSLHAAPLSQALESLKENPYGFVFVDVGITEEDLKNFRSIDIQTEHIYHQIGELDTLHDGIIDFIDTVGANDLSFASQVAARLVQIAHEVIEASGKETALAQLHAFTSTNKYDLSRWHMDRPYYIPEGQGDLPFKFAVTLRGPSTLFYLLPPELRKTIKSKMSNKSYMKQFCLEENIVRPQVGKGAVFIGGQDHGRAALHAEPPIHENRLFFTIVPCTEKQLPDLRANVLAIYPKNPGL